MAQPDLNKLINSSEVQSVLRPVRGGAITKRSHVQKKNPLQNKQVMLRLNPYAAAYKKQGLGQQKVDAESSSKDKTFEATLHEN
jgi:large subunit ribosomal protein L4e